MFAGSLLGSSSKSNSSILESISSMASPSSQTSFQRAREYTPEEWETIRESFTRLYQSPQKPKLTLSNIQMIMKEEYGFDATLRQYKRKVKLWNLERNIKTDDSKFMVQKEAQRKQQEGKKTKFMVNGREVTEAKFARIRRKLFKTSSPANQYMCTPRNIRYFTPRDPAINHTSSNSTNHGQQRRLSQSHNPIISASTHTHLIECFLCQVNTYGQELTIMQAFQEHIRSAHPGYGVLRCLNGQDASLVPGAVRTTKQLPSNQVGYVHGIRTDNLETVHLGRLCHVEDSGGGGGIGRRPYLTLTHATSCLTLRADPRPDFHFDSGMIQPQTPISPFPMNSAASFDFDQHATAVAQWSMTPFALHDGNYQEDVESYFTSQLLPLAEDGSNVFDDWSIFDDDFKDQQQQHWKANAMY